MTNNPFLIKMALALVLKVAIIIAALYVFWPAPRPSPALPRTGWDAPDFSVSAG